MKKWLWIAVPLLSLGALIAWRFAAKKQTEAGTQMEAGARRGMAPSVIVAKASGRLIVDSIESVATLTSPQRAQISPRTSGRIEYLRVREGDRVTAGQVLVKIDPSDLQAAVYQQQANVAEARARLAQAQLGQGATEVGVESQIAQQGAGVSSAKADYSQAKRNYDAQVASARAGLDDAKAKVGSAQAQARNAEAELGRQRANLKNAQARLARIENLYRQGFIAAQDVDDARTAAEAQQGAVSVAEGQAAAARSAVLSAQAQQASASEQVSIVKRKGQADVAAARARVTQAEASLRVARANRSQGPAYAQNIAALGSAVAAAQAQLDQSKARLKDTILRSPVNGTVTTRQADPGSLASPSQAVVVVEYLDWLYAETSLPIDRIGDVREGLAADVTLDAAPGKVFRGVVTNIAPSADLQNRQFGIKVKLPNPGHALRPGMFGRAAFVIKSVRADVAVPREAIRTSDEGTTVTVVDPDATARVRRVELGASSEKYVEILSGVSPGETVVVLSYQPVRDGQKVKLPGPPTGAGGNKTGSRRRGAP